MCLMMSCVGSTLMYLYIEREVLSCSSPILSFIFCWYRSALLFSWYSALAFWLHDLSSLSCARIYVRKGLGIVMLDSCLMDLLS